MLRIGWIIAGIGVFTLLLNATVEPSFARQTNTQQKTAQPRKGGKQIQTKTRTTQTVTAKKQQSATAGKATKTTASKKEVRAKTSHSRSERRIVRVQSHKRVALR